MPINELCPKDCVFYNDDDLDFIHKDCHHSKDQIYSEPIPAEMIWYANVWINCFIIGENGDNYLIRSPKAEGVTSIKKKSPLIRR